MQRKRTIDDTSRATIDAPLLDAVRDVRKMSLDQMKAKLEVDLFDILFHYDDGIV